MLRRFSFSRCLRLVACVLCALEGSRVHAQGPTPETAATLFPGGAYVSYGSTFTTRRLLAGSGSPGPAARASFGHQGLFTFTWGMRRDLQLTVMAPVNTQRFDFAPPAAGATSASLGGTGLGDAIVFVKYRFLRFDSERGTTQTSISVGPKLPTGRTSLRDGSGALLPAGLQLGSGSTDLFLNLSWTYTGLFNIKRLVADETLTYLWRHQGTQQTALGSMLESRFWLSYRPYQERLVGREWFIGPTVTWLHTGEDRRAGVAFAGTGGDGLLLGFTTYVGLRPGTTAWFSADFLAAQTENGIQSPMKHRFSFGITQQFRLRR